MSDEEYDITKSIALVGSDSDSDSSSGSGSEFDSENESLQDEIIDSSDEEEDQKQKDWKLDTSKNTPKQPLKFPKLEVDDDEDENDKDKDDYYFGAPGTKKINAGTFAGMGLSKTILHNIQKKGYKNPTPIQRKTIPVILDGNDVVGMARTGSGKTAAFVLPMLERLKTHSAKVGARALILAPSRELALQTMKVIKDFSRGSDLRSVLLVGGDSLEQQFGWMMSNPDIIIATPGRFMHLKVEMQLELKSIEYIVFDEADRLFEMGFAEQLNEILAALSTDRQTLLFSATLPKSLVDFAKAGLTDPILVRLDAESKLSQDLELSFYAVKDGQRDAVLYYTLESVIKMPLANDEQKRLLKGRQEIDSEEEEEDRYNENRGGKRARSSKPFVKRKRMAPAHELPCPESTIVFVPTKHHVEYVANLLTHLGYAVSFIYGTLDQTARKEQLYRFRAGITSIMVVTDIAARGIDIPVLANVINYSLPSSPKVFIHRVGRTARAGRSGRAYSLVRDTELAYLVDLEVFLGRKLLLPRNAANEFKDLGDINYNERLVLGSVPRDGLEMAMEHLDTILKREYDISNMRDVADRGEKLYIKTRGTASHESIKRAKQLLLSGWDELHPHFGRSEQSADALKQQLLDKFANRKSKDTVFEIRKMTGVTDLMARRRKQLAPIQQFFEEKKHDLASIMGTTQKDSTKSVDNEDDDEEQGQKVVVGGSIAQASEKDIEATFGKFKDSRFYLSHYEPNDVAQEKGYSMQDDGGFAGAARTVQFDLAGDGKEFTQKQGMRWDKKKGKYINAGGADNKKYITGENGTKILASYRSGRFDSWKAAHKTGNIKVGSMEDGGNGMDGPGRRFKHNKVSAPKPADRARDDYKNRKEKVAKAVEKGLRVKGVPVPQGSQLHSTDQIRKQRREQEKRREKNARPAHRKRRR